MILTSITVQTTLSILSLTVRKNDGTDWMMAVEYKIEIVVCIDKAINGENVATDWL